MLMRTRSVPNKDYCLDHTFADVMYTLGCTAYNPCAVNEAKFVSCRNDNPKAGMSTADHHADVHQAWGCTSFLQLEKRHLTPHLFQKTTVITVISSLFNNERPCPEARLSAVTSHGLLRAEAATF